MAVQRTGTRIEIHKLGNLRLFREDMEDIANALAELGDLEIICDNTYRADRGEDFSGLPERIESLQYVVAVDDVRSAVRDPRRIEVELSRWTSYVRLVEPDVLCEGILSRIRTVVSRPSRRRININHRGLMAAHTIFTLGLAAVTAAQGATWIITNKISSGGINYLIAPFGLWVAVSLGLMFLLARGRGPRVSLRNYYRSDRPSFWRRTRDDWLVQIIGGALFLVLGFILGKVAS
ncbi:hypothetical protein Skr01_33620 [Sphaerisporangium krabiense]|uniref:Uncharacterized protein n=1 Tax=Sphaerisporangium krabiense TaxID=763782 RepID=A0A7W9DPF2_9ACTN|nr:hypothetical protein [Sphaerisporangium krabiense]MBB5626361.1 hypothetical protein [Sphaerisporangium krabiense]GII63277.1 hypothetical protein Skr01_33620 [Sphaerisporangium krabiense]